MSKQWLLYRYIFTCKFDVPEDTFRESKKHELPYDAMMRNVIQFTTYPIYLLELANN